jgi:S-adenosylmethionine:tRNA ribosyltransferase-isomerase
MLVLGVGGQLQDSGVGMLSEQLRPSDCLVVNDTRVRAARLRGRSGDHEVELLLIQSQGEGVFLALGRPGRRLRPGMTAVGDGWRATVKSGWDAHPGGLVVGVETDPGTDLDSLGEIPLPPYVRVPLRDPERYQTVYSAGPPRSAAAPTAGLHLTHPLLRQLGEKGVAICAVRLEVGLATFAPIRAATIEAHQMHSERFEISAAAAEMIAETRRRGGRVVAVGTTVVRCLESRSDGSGGVVGGSGETELYLLPGSRFQVVDGLLTNFHQPRSSLMVLVSAFFGEARVRRAYQHALRRGYRFLSFGDCMFGWAE